MKPLLFGFLALLTAVRLEAQPAPTIVSTLQTTNTSATSLQVGCAIGSGLCTGGIVSGPIASGPISIGSGYVEIQSFVPASQTNRLVNNSGTLQWNGSTLAIGGSISGAVNTIPVFTASNAIGNSIMTQSGTTITVANTLSATNLTGTLTTASQPNVTGVGTITTGTWNATKIGLAFGGTNADLSGTGGASQFLRQNTLGAAITVVRPAVADLSDASNVALLNAANVFTGQNSTSFNTNSGVQGWNFRNLNAGSLANIQVQVGNDVDGQLGILTAYSSTVVDSAMAGANVTSLRANGRLNLGTTSTGAVNLFTNNTLRWGINSGGDLMVGSAGTHMAWSVGAPTLSGGGTAAAVSAGCSDSACTVFTGNTASTQIVLTFNHLLGSPNLPTCVASTDVAAYAPVLVAASGSAVTVNYSSAANGHITVLCFNGS